MWNEVVWRSQTFWCPGRVVTMAAPNRNYELKKIKFHYIRLSNLKFAKFRTSIFSFEILILSSF